MFTKTLVDEDTRVFKDDVFKSVFTEMQFIESNTQILSLFEYLTSRTRVNLFTRAYSKIFLETAYSTSVFKESIHLQEPIENAYLTSLFNKGNS